MNFKRNWLLISAFIGTIFLVAGCADKKAFVPYSFISEVSDPHQDEILVEGAAIRKGNFEDYYAKGVSDDTLVNVGQFYDVMTKRGQKKIFQSEGDQKLLVVPVDFKDYKIGNSEKINDYINNVNKAFFGASKNNSFVSVSQYYNVSSYGKLRITGEVCKNVFEFPAYAKEIILQNGNNNDLRDLIWSQYDTIVNFCKASGVDVDSYRLHQDEEREFDIPIYLIYNVPADSTTNKNNFFWNFTFPEKSLAWTSYHSLHIVNDKPDAHVLIHEVGHLLGLLDYYPTETTSDTETMIEPVGCIDMMDSSVGDHTSLSKMMLNWTRPIHVTNSCELTISSLAEKGDLILLNDNWNGSVFDEYYLLEFYTPTSLNTFDVVYGNNKVKLPEIPGVKIYHVDATLGYYVKEGGIRDKYTLKATCDAGGYDPKSTKIDFVRDNTNYTKSFGGAESKNYLYELIYNNERSMTGPASDEHLFHTGDSKTGFLMNGNRSANYKISVTNLNYRDATIKIEKLN